MKIKIITPVHVSSGEYDRGYLYRVDKSIVNKYEASDLFYNMDYEVLLNKNNLQAIYYNKNSLSSLFRNNDFNKLTPSYSLSLNCEFNPLERDNNVSIHIKNMNKPYIPGSTIKGTIMNAILYDIVKINYKKIIDYHNDKNNRNGIKKLNLHKAIEICYGVKDRTLINLFSSCIECYDLEFEKMSLYKAERINVGRTMPLGYKECISYNQEKETNLFSINKNKVKILNLKTTQENFKEVYRKYLNADNLLKLMFEFTNDMLEEELKNESNIEHGLIDYIRDLKDNKNLIRVGNSTNYWFKTVSKIFKEKDYEFYKRNFNYLFRSGKRAKLHTMPKTRVILVNDSSQGGYDDLPGFIEIIK